MLLCICTVTDHKRRQNVVRTLLTHSAIALSAMFLFLPHEFGVICLPLLNRLTATWNLFVKLTWFPTILSLALFWKNLLQSIS